nr:MAG TPA: hypothetical protein [Caudoviricetes sp.]
MQGVESYILQVVNLPLKFTFIINYTIKKGKRQVIGLSSIQ